MDRITGDAVLSGQDVIWLTRRNGQLTLNERADIWPAQRLAAVQQASRRETMSFAED